MTGKGIGFAAVGALVGGAVWFILMRATGMNLWVLAPIVGGSAGYGMMRGTQMRGGLPAGAVAALFTIVAIVAVRAATVSTSVREVLSVDETDLVEEIAFEVAEEWADEEYEVYDEENDDFLPAVYTEARQRWDAIPSAEQQARIADWAGYDDVSVPAVTAASLIWDFGFFGFICAGLAAGTAFKTGSITLEQAIIERGYATEGEEVRRMAADLRCKDRGVFARLGQPDPARSADAAPPSERRQEQDAA